MASSGGHWYSHWRRSPATRWRRVSPSSNAAAIAARSTSALYQKEPPQLELAGQPRTSLLRRVDRRQAGAIARGGRRRTAIAIAARGGRRRGRHEPQRSDRGSRRGAGGALPERRACAPVERIRCGCCCRVIKDTTTYYPSPRLSTSGNNPARAASLRGPRSASAGHHAPPRRGIAAGGAARRQPFADPGGMDGFFGNACRTARRRA